MTTKKFIPMSIPLDRDMHARMERVRKQENLKMNRSAFVRAAIEAFLKQVDEDVV